MVNGIVASPFAMNHMLANMFYNVHRALYAVSPVILGIPSLRRLNEVSLIWSGRVGSGHCFVYVHENVYVNPLFTYV